MVEFCQKFLFSMRLQTNKQQQEQKSLGFNGISLHSTQIKLKNFMKIAGREYCESVKRKVLRVK